MQLEDNLWAATDNLRANIDLKSSEYATPVLSLIFLKFADNEYSKAEKVINKELANPLRPRPIRSVLPGLRARMSNVHQAWR